MSPDPTVPDQEAIARRVVEALVDYQRLSLEVLEMNADDPESAVRGLIDLHLDWTEANRHTARLIARHRNEVMAGPHGEALMSANQEFFAAMKAWIERQAETGLLSPVSFNLMHAVIFAPTQEIAKLALSGRLKKPLPKYSKALGDAAWAGLRALPERSQPGPTTES